MCLATLIKGFNNQNKATLIQMIATSYGLRATSNATSYDTSPVKRYPIAFLLLFHYENHSLLQSVFRIIFFLPTNESELHIPVPMSILTMFEAITSISYSDFYDIVIKTNIYFWYALSYNNIWMNAMPLSFRFVWMI